MEWHVALIMMLGIVVGSMFLGLPVVIAFFAANIAGTWIFMGGDAGLATMPMEFQRAIGRFSLTPVALFLLMGELLFHTGVAFRAIGAIDRLISRVPGRLSVVSIVGGTVFSSLSGSTIANTAILGSVLLPDMVKRGYQPTIAMGPIMATGGIAMLIPPSALAVLLASLAEQSIAKLLIAGILPGILMAILFFAYVVGRCRLNPSLAPAYDVEELTPRERWMPFVKYVLPLFSIFIVVVGSIFFKWAAPTEAAALGCLAAALACICYRALTWQALKKALLETAKINTMIMIIIAGSLTFSQVLAVSGSVDGLLAQVTAFNPTPFVAIILMMAVLLFLGAFMDQVSMLLLTLPFFLPFAAAQGIDALWLMVLMLIVMEISLLTPPFGLLLFVMKGVAPFKTTLVQIYAAAAPFVAIELFVLALLILFPSVALWLPKLID
jgi:tripartite ATP-independent transporter DctM subunit